MKFCDRLNLYIETLGCSAKTLSAVSGISDAAISRYRSGEREPGRDSEQLLRLAQGICAIAAESDYSPSFSEGEVLCTLRASLHTEKSDFDSAVQNLKNLLTAFGISYAELSRAMNFDASYLSRVCSGQRKPANTEEFITQVCRYVFLLFFLVIIRRNGFNTFFLLCNNRLWNRFYIIYILIILKLGMFASGIIHSKHCKFCTQS